MGIFSRLFGGGTVKTTADHPFLIRNPRIGFLNLKGAEGETLARADALVLGPLFPGVEHSDRVAPRCDVLFLYCDFDAAGKIAGTSGTLRDCIKSAGAYVAVVASENASQPCVRAMEGRNDWHANIALVLERRADKFAVFFRRLFEAMLTGQSMLMAWVALAPQVPGREDPDVPSTMMVAEAGHVAFGK